MRADELVALASAHGIDLRRVAGNTSNVFGIARKRTRTAEERRLGVQVEPTVRSIGSRSHPGRSVNSAIVGEAAAGMPRMPWLAACYSIAGDTAGYPELHRGLMVQELELSRQQNWPMMVTRRDGRRGYYQAELAALVLDADRHKPLFSAAPALFALCMDINEDVWSRNVSRWYGDLEQQYRRWLDISRSIIARWIREDEDTPNRAA